MPSHDITPLRHYYLLRHYAMRLYALHADIMQRHASAAMFRDAMIISLSLMPC